MRSFIACWCLPALMARRMSACQSVESYVGAALREVRRNAALRRYVWNLTWH